MKLFYTVLSAVIMALVLNSCATIFSGTKAGVSVKGSPETAKVYLNGNYEGTAPTKVRVSKKALKNNQTSITIEKEGYLGQEVVLTRKVKVGALIGNIVFTGIVVGNVIDFATGAIYKPHPGKISYSLTPKSTANPKLKEGDKVVFTTDKYENAEGEIIAVYPNRALIKAVVKNNKVQTKLKGEEYSEIEIEVPFVNIAKK
jgi:hypothetical protein